MPQIYQMPPELANRIAAGEVVERPGSVVKELVENAVDAGAKHITVELRSGGVAYLRVTDDGKGILPEDVRTAFLPHATSKVRRESDLDAISTLGFRGEALAAIASVARVDLFTRTRFYQEGIQISLEGGKETGYGETGCPLGTTVVVRDLFFNVPARAKFLKKDATEGAYAEGLVTQIATSRPEIAFRFIKEGRESFSTSGDGKMISAIYACGGRDLAGRLLALAGSFGELRVTGYISPPELNRAARNQQSFYINGRYVRSRLLTAAVEEAYKGRLMTGRYPICYLNLQMNLSAVDVNVHPSKLEVKFSREKEVFSAVYHSVVSALEAGGQLAELKKKPSALTPREDNVTETQLHLPEKKVPEYVFPETFRRSESKVASSGGVRYQTAADRMSAPKQPPKMVEPALEPGVFTVHHWEPPALEKQPEPVKPEPAGQEPAKQEQTKQEPSAPQQPEQARAEVPQKEAAGPRPAVRVLGEVFHTYIIAEDADGLWLIDKHAAHEKMIFDRLRSRQEQQPSQLLLTPKTVTLTPTETETCLRQREPLRRAGFELEEFGRGALLVREAPMYLEEQDIPFVLSDLAARLSSFRGGENELLDELLKSVACKSAVKAGMVSDPQELQRFAEAVLADDSIRNCPHGRPCITYLSRYQLEKLFKRVL